MTLKPDLPLLLRLRRRTTGAAMKAQTVLELLKSRGMKNPSKATIYDCLYEAEHWQQMTDPKGTAARPYLRYVCSNLFVSSPSHVEKHGIILPADHPFWLLWYPPNGKGCTCTVTSVSEELLKRAGWKVSEPRKFQFPFPDVGFDFNIGNLLVPIDRRPPARFI